ncbi:MAG: hypothetical protein QXM38_03755, partial [Candidatus Aenigmatarchaeota archaeon]
MRYNISRIYQCISSCGRRSIHFVVGLLAILGSSVAANYILPSSQLPASRPNVILYQPNTSFSTPTLYSPETSLQNLACGLVKKRADVNLNGTWDDQDVGVVGQPFFVEIVGSSGSIVPKFSSNPSNLDPNTLVVYNGGYGYTKDGKAVISTGPGGFVEICGLG